LATRGGPDVTDDIAMTIIYPPVLRSSVSGSQDSGDNAWAAASCQLGALLVGNIGVGP